MSRCSHCKQGDNMRSRTVVIRLGYMLLTTCLSLSYTQCVDCQDTPPCSSCIPSLSPRVPCRDPSHEYRVNYSTKALVMFESGWYELALLRGTPLDIICTVYLRRMDRDCYIRNGRLDRHSKIRADTSKQMSTPLLSQLRGRRRLQEHKVMPSPCSSRCCIRSPTFNMWLVCLR
jgi:hypothetical protein